MKRLLSQTATFLAMLLAAACAVGPRVQSGNVAGGVIAGAPDLVGNRTIPGERGVATIEFYRPPFRCYRRSYTWFVAVRCSVFQDDDRSTAATIASEAVGFDGATAADVFESVSDRYRVWIAEYSTTPVDWDPPSYRTLGSVRGLCRRFYVERRWPSEFEYSNGTARGELCLVPRGGDGGDVVFAEVQDIVTTRDPKAVRPQRQTFEAFADEMLDTLVVR